MGWKDPDLRKTLENPHEARRFLRRDYPYSLFYDWNPLDRPKAVYIDFDHIIPLENPEKLSNDDAIIAALAVLRDVAIGQSERESAGQRWKN